MGFASYYRAFVPNFAEVTAPLTALLKKAKTGFQWTEEASEALGKTKRALLDACERYAWDPEREDRVTTDASGLGIGATFEQRVEGVGWAPVAFWSRKLSEAEKRYSATDQEWLAVIEAVTRHWRHWLRGRKISIAIRPWCPETAVEHKGGTFRTGNIVGLNVCKTSSTSSNIYWSYTIWRQMP